MLLYKLTLYLVLINLMPLPEKAGGNTIVCVSKQQKVAFCDSSLPFWKAICPFLWASDLKYK